MNKTFVLYGFGGIVVCAVLLGVYLYLARGAVTPEVATVRLYQAWYSARSGGDTWAPLSEGLHRKSTYVSESFARSVERAYERGVDTVWCESPGEGDITVRDVRTDTDNGTSRVDISIGERVLRAFLVQDTRGWWRVDEVDCISGTHPTREGGEQVALPEY